MTEQVPEAGIVTEARQRVLVWSHERYVHRMRESLRVFEQVIRADERERNPAATYWTAMLREADKAHPGDLNAQARWVYGAIEAQGLMAHGSIDG